MSNTVTGAAPAALGKPISEVSRSRWPKKKDTTTAAGWPEGSETAWKDRFWFSLWQRGF